jgi:uncharacterized protein
MIIDLKTIPFEGKKYFSYTLDRGWWSPGEDDYQIEAIETPISVDITINRVGNKYVLDGAFKGALRVACDRCLESYRQGLRLNLILSDPAPDDIEQDELELMEDDIEVVFIHDDKIDLNEVIREQPFLSLPVNVFAELIVLDYSKMRMYLNVSSVNA